MQSEKRAKLFTIDQIKIYTEKEIKVTKRRLKNSQ